jgi:hypothetical protein
VKLVGVIITLKKRKLKSFIHLQFFTVQDSLTSFSGKIEYLFSIFMNF